MAEMLEDNKKIWAALIGDVKEGFLGLKGRAVIQDKKAGGAFQEMSV